MHRSTGPQRPFLDQITSFNYQNQYMRKLLLLIACSMLTLGAAKAQSFYTEDFNSGMWSGYPIGWTTGTFSGSTTWHWANSPSTGGLSIGAIASPTAANGWMIFDADFTLVGGSTGGTTIPSGYMQSPGIDCSTHPTVGLTFSSFFRKYQDSCFVWVGSDPSFTPGSYTSYPVYANNSLFNTQMTANPVTVHINISAAAASNPNVYVRFVYFGSPGGSYSWLMDDVSLAELNTHDVSIGSSFMYQDNTSAYHSSIFSTPLAFADTVHPVTLLNNVGASDEASVPVTAQIFRGSTSVFSETINFAGLSVTGFDSIVEFSGYKPDATGSYSCVFNAGLSGDGDLSNNSDTVNFAVTDTTWMVNSGPVLFESLIHNAGTGVSFMSGARFDVPSASAGDTLSGFGVCFGVASTATNTGATVSVQLYSTDQFSTSWTYVGSSVARAVVSTDISTSSSLVWAYFPVNALSGLTPFILQPGKTYAAIVQTNGVTTMLTLNATGAPNATGYAGYFGQTGSSMNDGAASFGATTATGTAAAVPMVRLYFGPPCTTPVAGTISGPSTVCLGTPVSLTTTGTGGVWAISNTTAAMVDGAGVVTGLVPGIDTVAYIIVNGCGYDFAIHPITVVEPPFAGIMSGASDVCVGNSITLTVTGTGGVWDHSNGSTFVSTSGVVLGVMPGIDTILYSVTNSCGTVVAYQAVTVGSSDHGVITGSDTVCIGDNVVFTESVSGGLWTTVMGHALISGSGNVLGVNAGIDTVKYAVTSSCGTTYATKTIVVVDCSTGVNDITRNAGITVYPNPASDVITIKAVENVTKVQVMNLLGQEVYSSNGNGKETIVDLKGQPSGTYIVKVNDTYTVRIMKN